MNTEHRIINANAKRLDAIDDESVALIVTSPPYPMIEMWDQVFSEQSSEVSQYLKEGKGNDAFEAMHQVLDQVWSECDRVLIPNGFVCINIGDATRTISGEFQLYSNHARIINHFSDRGYSVLPDILWRKQSNSPNKFMGSGMYPAGAYVTYEHEYILVFRKGGKRIFSGKTKDARRESAYFWEERNVWFSDLWEIKGTNQTIKGEKARERSAAFPFEIPYRLVNMYSVKGDLVLDPFSGLGTTTMACMASQRNSIGYELDPAIFGLSVKNMDNSIDDLNRIIQTRLDAHTNFISLLSSEQRKKCYKNGPHGFLVKTRQEIELSISFIKNYMPEDNKIICQYA